MKTALVLIDIQKDYFPGGRMPLVGSESASLQARRLLEYFRQTDRPVVFIQHIAKRAGATFFLPGTEGAEIHPNIQPLDGEEVIVKHFPNSFRETTLESHLRALGVERLVISGMMTHMCIDTSARAAVDLGFTNLIAGNACATRDLVFENETLPAAQVHASFLAALNGSFGKVLHTEDVIAQLSSELAS